MLILSNCRQCDRLLQEIMGKQKSAEWAHAQKISRRVRDLVDIDELPEKKRTSILIEFKAPFLLFNSNCGTRPPFIGKTSIGLESSVGKYEMLICLLSRFFVKDIPYLEYEKFVSLRKSQCSQVHDFIHPALRELCCISVHCGISEKITALSKTKGILRALR